MTPPASAIEEAWEEAGIGGFVDETSLGTDDYEKWGGTCTVEVFAITAVTEAAEGDYRWAEAVIIPRPRA